MRGWVAEMQARLDNLGNWSQEEQLGRKNTSIYKVPPFISNINKGSYQPRVVSFGPYHHGEPHLASMETHKERAFLCSIHRSRQPVQEVYRGVMEVAQKLKDSYDSHDYKWEGNTEKFVKLMILDGCFMLELLRVAYQPKNYYSDNDLIFSRHGDLYVVPLIKVDMLLLENQLPMLLLLRLKRILENVEPNLEKLNASILWLHNYDIKDGKYSKMGECLHVLDLLRKGLLHTHNEHRNAAPQSPDQREGKDKWAGHNVVFPATELHKAGIHFMKSESKSPRDITFDGGVLKLPNFIVDDYTKLMFLNLLAFERCHIPAGNDITSFIAFMDRIIVDSWDVKLLSSKGIIDNFIGSDEEAANLFNTMSKDLIMEMTDNLDQVYTNLVEYCNMPWNTWLANLAQTYFKSPWTIISVITAILFFFLLQRKLSSPS